MSIKNGEQSARIVTHGLKGDDGKEQYEIEFDCDGGRIRWWGGFKTDKATKYTIKQLRSWGWKGEDLATVKLSTEPVTIVVGEEDYNGAKRQKVMGSGGGSAPMDTSKAQSFAQRMAAKVKALETSAASDFDSDTDFP